METRDWTNPYAVVLDEYIEVLYGNVEVSLVDLIVCESHRDAQADVRHLRASGVKVALLIDTVGQPTGGNLSLGVAVALGTGDVSNTERRVELTARATFEKQATGPRGLCLSSLRVEGAAAALPGVDVSALDFG